MILSKGLMHVMFSTSQIMKIESIPHSKRTWLIFKHATIRSAEGFVSKRTLFSNQYQVLIISILLGSSL